jgi:hypothetical protein
MICYRELGDRLLVVKRIVAIGFIFVCSALAWLVLAASISSRTNDSNQKLRPGVASTWGAAQEQSQPTAMLDEPSEPQKSSKDQASAPPFKPAVPIPLNAERTRVHADLALEYRQKGLLWYGTYQVQFSGDYTFRNSEGRPGRMLFNFYFPTQQAVYDDLAISANGQPLPFSADQNGAAAWLMVPAGQTVEFRVGYKSRGLESWRYSLGKDIRRTRDFALVIDTNFADVDFPPNTLSPTEKTKTQSGWELAWRYRNLISGFEIGITMPGKLQPGPLAGEISTFAPVSLFLFFFVLFMLTTVRKIELHPMNYFFLASAFFAFHLLLAYSVDHISIQLAFAVSSLVSIALVVSYLRIVVGPRFAIAEAGLAQFVFLVLFSFSFFLNGFTGLAITLGCIVTLFIAMQVTARVQWREHFAGVSNRR